MAGKHNFITILIVLLVFSAVVAKKSRKSKQHKVNFDETAQQPNDDVAYTSFGIDDVVGYDAFVPNSPDYAGYLDDINEDSTNGLYAPAFPTAFETTGNTEDYNNINNNKHVYGNENKITPVETEVRFEIKNNSSDPFIPQSNSNFGGIEHKASNIYRDQYSDTMPEYGTRLPPKKNTNSLNMHNFNYNLSDQHFKSTEIQHEKPTQQLGFKTYSDYDSKNNINFNNFNPKLFSNYNQNAADTLPMEYSKNVSFPKIIDFTKSQLPNPFQSNLKNQFQNGNSQVYLENTTEDTYNKHVPKYKTPYNVPNKNPFYNSYAYEHKPIAQMGNSNYKHYNKTGLSMLNGNINEWYSKINYGPDATTLKTYHKNAHKRKNNALKYRYSRSKKPHSNAHKDNHNSPKHTIKEFTNQGFSGNGYSTFEEDYYNQMLETNKLQSILNPYYLKNPHNGPDISNEDVFTFPKPTEDAIRYNLGPTFSTYWSNNFNMSNSDSLYKNSLENGKNENNPENVVYIPKRPQKDNSAEKHIAESTNNWNSYASYAPLQTAQLIDEWNKEVSGRFKSEEDLLGLRNHDTSRPSYLPSFNWDSYVGNFHELEPMTDHMEEIENSRYSHIRSRPPWRFERGRSPSENYPVHVPILKPYPVKVPHPIIVPVPQPYPVQVPVPKPKAVPIVQEVKLPIEKPVPYPVEKKVPYPIEKLVPVPVQKEVAVTAIKPYPVPIPQLRPVYHHSNPVYDAGDVYDDHDYYEEEHEEYLPPSTHKEYRSKKKTIVKLNKSKSPRGYRPHRSSQSHFEDYNQSRRQAQKSSTQNSHYTKSRRSPHTKSSYLPQRANPSDYLN